MIVKKMKGGVMMDEWWHKPGELWENFTVLTLLEWPEVEEVLWSNCVKN